MIKKEEAKVLAWVAISNLMGNDYFRRHFEGSYQAYPPEDEDEVEYKYFLGFEYDEASGLWTVFARVSVNRETKEVIFFDYKLPNGKRMKNPIKPTSFA